MITSGSTLVEFEEGVRVPKGMPLELRTGQPLIPRNRILLGGAPGAEWTFRVIDEPGGAESRVETANELTKNLFESQVRFTSAELRRKPNSPHLLDNCGVSYLNVGDLKRAKECFEKAIELKPDMVTARAHLGKVCLLEGNLSEAAEVFRRLVSERPADPRWRLNLAHIFMRKRDLDEAEAVLEGGELRQDAHVANTLGVLRLLKGDYARALARFRDAARQNVRSTAGHNNLGVAYALTKSFARAERSFQAVLNIDPYNADAVKNLASLFQEKGEHQRAIRLLEEYLERRSKDIEARDIAALCHFRTGNYVQGLKHLTVVFRSLQEGGGTSAEWGRIGNNIGVVFQGLGEFDKAEEFYSNAIKWSGGANRTVFHNLLGLYLRRRRGEELKRVAEECLAKHPDDGQAVLGLAQYHWMREEYEETADLAREAIARQPKSSAPHAVLGCVLAEAYGDYAEAIRVTEEGLSRAPEDKALKNNLAYFYLMNGEVIKARRLLDSVRVGESDVHLTATRGLLLLKEGDVQEGSRLYNEAARIAGESRLRDEVLQKKHLELGRIELEARHEREAGILLRRALHGPRTVHRRQAAKMLEALGQKTEPGDR